MQPRTFVAALIFLASYLPLSVILLFQDLDRRAEGRRLCEHWDRVIQDCVLPFRHPFLSISFVVLCMICLGVSLVAIAILRPKDRIEIVASKHVPADLMNYVLPYIVSFTSLDYGHTGKFLGFIVFFAWIFLITLRSGQLIMNPVLTVFGWRLYDLEYRYDGGSGTIHSGMALCQTPLTAGDVRRQQPLQDIMIIKAGD